MDQRVQNGIATRQRILARAQQLASVEGLTGLSIGRLAADLGLSKAGLFAHFGSKEELQLATLDAAFAVFTERVLAPLEPQQPALLHLTQLCQSWLAYLDSGVFEGGCFFVASASELDGRPGPLRDRLQAALQTWRRGLEVLANEAIRQHHLKADTDLVQLSFELYSLVLGANWSRQLFADADATRRAGAAMSRCLRACATEQGSALLTQRHKRSRGRDTPPRGG